MKKKLRLYHGTTEADIDLIVLNKCRDKSDFGKGFYLTTDINQAISWARRQYMRKNSLSWGTDVKAYVYEFILEGDALNEYEKLNKHTFQGANISWIDYILKNRYVNTTDYYDYDVVIGKVADSVVQRVFNAILSRCEYDINKIKTEDKKRLISDLKPNNLTDQYCFKTKRAIDILNQKASKKRMEVTLYGKR